MTSPAGDMSQNPGDPENTDEEATSVPGFGESILDPEEAAIADSQGITDEEMEALLEEAEVAANEGKAGDDLEAKLEERTEDLQRLTAEYSNYRRRTERERKAAVEEAKAGLMKELLPILDDLELAAQHGDLDEGPLKAFADKFRSTLETLRLEGYGAEGDAFDPEIHEAVQDTSNGETKVVGTVLRKGYRLGDRVIRHAMVVISDPTEA